MGEFRKGLWTVRAPLVAMVQRVRIKFFETSSRTALRANDPLTLSFSEIMEGVMSFCLGTSASIFS